MCFLTEHGWNCARAVVWWAGPLVHHMFGLCRALMLRSASWSSRDWAAQRIQGAMIAPTAMRLQPHDAEGAAAAAGAGLPEP